MLTQTPRRRLRDHFHRAGNFGCNGEHAHMPASRLPEAVEDRDGRLDQAFRRVHTSPFMAEKRAFEMNAQRPRTDNTVALGFDRVRQPLQSRASRIERCGNSSGKISGDAVRGEKLP